MLVRSYRRKPTRLSASENKGYRFSRVNKEKVKSRVKARQPMFEILDRSRVSLKEKERNSLERRKRKGPPFNKANFSYNPSVSRSRMPFASGHDFLVKIHASYFCIQTYFFFEKKKKRGSNRGIYI